LFYNQKLNFVSNMSHSDSHYPKLIRMDLKSYDKV